MTKKISVNACPDRNYIYIDGVEGHITSNEARELASALYREADYIDGQKSLLAVWRGDDPRPTIGYDGEAIVVWTGISAVTVTTNYVRRDESWPEGWLWTRLPGPMVKL